MLLDINEIIEERGQIVDREFSLDDGDVADVQLSGAARGTVRVQNARRNLVISGQCNSTVQLSCARCLKHFSLPLEIPLEAAAPLSLFLPPQHPMDIFEEDDSEEEDLVDAEEMADLFRGHCLDVSELVRQAIWLALPIKPLCSDNCEGLAPQFLAKSHGDERLAKLKEWQQQRS